MKEVVVIFDPTIDIQKHGDIKIPDIKDIPIETKKRVGRYAPFIDINGFQFDHGSIESFELSIGKSFLPTISCTLQDTFGVMRSYGTLTDDVLKLFIRSDNKDFKPIRQNFRIINSSSSSGSENARITIFGILEIEDFHHDLVKSFGKKSSFDTLQDIAKLFGLGFASNDTKTDDVMTRICPNITIQEFLQTDLIPSMYKDDKSFFRVFVDQYYYLNVVEVNELFDIDIDLRKVRESLKYGDRDFDTSDEEKSEMTPFFLSNANVKLLTENGISYYRVVNSIGDMTEDGNKISCHYYDHDSREYKEFFQKSLETEGDSHKLTDRTVHKSVNFIEQYSENVHKNYYFSKMSNLLQRKSSSRFGLECHLMDINNYVRVCQQIPIFIQRDREERDRAGDREEGIRFDNMLSGQYVSDDLSYVYRSDRGFYTRLKCVKRDFWKGDDEEDGGGK